MLCGFLVNIGDITDASTYNRKIKWCAQAPTELTVEYVFFGLCYVHLQPMLCKVRTHDGTAFTAMLCKLSKNTWWDSRDFLTGRKIRSLFLLDSYDISLNDIEENVKLAIIFVCIFCLKLQIC